MNTGSIQVITRTGGEAPVGDVQITIQRSCAGQMATYRTDAQGYSDPVVVPAPPKELSLDENNTQRPYSVYDVTAVAEGYQAAVVNGVQVFEDENSLLEMYLIPTEEPGTFRASPDITNIPPHPLTPGTARETPSRGPEQNCAAQRILQEVVVPEKITVHLGKPAASAQNVTVSFRHYIKNVASSEIYPTWPQESLKANIYAQISLALNRIYTEWYKSKGYTYQITNSTSYDQYYVHNRNIFENISKLVDDIFNTYIRKTGTVNPYYAEYCDGKTVTCKGMKQWGTVTYANQGLSALSILRKYYTNIELVTTNNIRSIPESYPGTPLRVGSTGVYVRIIQRQLNRIAKDYPFFGTTPVDGVFGETTAAIVRKFQKQFSLTQDGVVGKSTWYKISYIYVSVKKLAQLTSEGEAPNGDNQTTIEGAWPGVVLRVGSTGSDVKRMQFYLNTVARFNTSIPTVSEDGIFGAATERAVKAFQTEAGLTDDGLVGRATWDALYSEYKSIESDINTDQQYPGQYPGQSFQQGSRGNYVRTIQFWLSIVSTKYSSVPSVTADGIFGAATTAAVRAFQQYFGLTVDGIVGRGTWDKLNEVYLDTVANLVPSGQRPGTYPGTPLRLGSRGDSVREMQYYLFILSAYYTEIPRISYDGVFGKATDEAVRAFQKLSGLTQDGVVGPQTWLQLYNTFLKLRNVDGPVYSSRVVPYPGKPLELGDDGTAVGWVQYLLAYIGEYYEEVQQPDVTGVFDDVTQSAVKGFQDKFNLPVTGVVDEETFNALVVTYWSVLATTQWPDLSLNGAYPGFVLTQNSAGPVVLFLQQMINDIALRFCVIDFVPEDGFFGAETRAAVESFQKGFGLEVTGFVDRATWDAIYEYYALEE